MDTVKKYQQIVISYLDGIAKRPYANTPAVEKQLIADKERNRFQLISFGWENEDKLVNSTLIYVEIRGGKVWIQQNWTEMEVASELAHLGIPKTDIVLGFVPAYSRADTEFAAA